MISDAFIRSVVSKISRLQISCAELNWYVHSGFQRYAMIINTGSRTDIPAFFSDWFYNRIRERYALVRNPYNPVSVTKYRLDPSVVDVISFCTKNPIPMLNRIHELDAFRTFFMVTITPYGTEIEPHVPEKKKVIENAIGKRLLVPTHSPARQGCSCLLGADIGEYNTCGHGCLYCYANYDQSAVLHNMSQHDPSSPLLIGHLTEHDIVHTAKQASWIDRQMSIFDLL